MFIAQKSADAIDIYANTTTDIINWNIVAPGRAVFQLSMADYAILSAWVSAGHYVGGVAPEPTDDPEGRHPGDPDYVPTSTPGVAPTWELLGNTARMKAGGDVELLDPTDNVVQTLHAAAIIRDVA